ncbi:SDR family oxidoreductase [Candidatus Pelagibacter sp.]|nr:SDR family oxidoreductase [Candidatus Pelagibacter sp.]
MRTFKKKVLILGGSSDIGLELLKKFLEKEIYKIDLHYNSNIKNFKHLKNKCNLIKADLSASNYKNTLKKFSKNYDIIVNLVGYINNKSFEKFTIKSLEKTLRINSLIPLLIIRMSITSMIKKKWGRILNSSSIGVKFGGGSKTFEYSFSKHLNEFIPSHLKKIADKNVFYNVIKIGLTNTKIHKKISNKDLKMRTNLLPIKKMAKPQDIASYIYYLSSDENQFITNELINITGGE